MENEAKVPRRKKVRSGPRRVMVGAAVRVELHQALVQEAAERNCSVSALAADVLAEHAGVDA